MIQQLNRYGPLDRPEEMKQFDIDSNPIDVALAVYQLWKPMVKNIGFRFNRKRYHRGEYDIKLADTLYDEALQIMKHYEEPFKKLNSDDLGVITSRIRPTDASGLFISAFFNSTDLPEMDGTFKHKIMGYRLPTGKRLIVRPNSKIYELGTYTEGEILNYGTVYGVMGWHAKRGIQINLGTVGNMATFSVGGTQINFGVVALGMGSGTDSGVQINFGYVSTDKDDPTVLGAIKPHEQLMGNKDDSMYGDRNPLGMARTVYGGVQLNYESTYRMSQHTFGGSQINLGIVTNVMGRFTNRASSFQLNLGNAFRDETFLKGEEIKQKMPILYQSLESRLNEVGILKDIKTEDAIEAILAYDWQSFEKDFLDLTERIEDGMK